MAPKSSTLLKLLVGALYLKATDMGKEEAKQEDALFFALLHPLLHAATNGGDTSVFPSFPLLRRF